MVDRKMIVTIGNAKGGVGKTTMSMTLGSGLADRGYRVLMIDTDAQGNLTEGFGMQKEPCFYDLLVRDGLWRDNVRSVPQKCWATDEKPKGQLFIVPSNEESRGIANQVEDSLLLQERLEEIEELFDFVVIDTSPTPSMLHAMIFRATRYFLGVTTAEYWSMLKMAETLARIERINKERVQQIEMVGIQVNKFRQVTTEHRENLIELKNRYSGLLWPVINERIVWTESAREHVAVYKHAPHDEATTQAQTLVRWLMGAIHVEQTI